MDGLGTAFGRYELLGTLGEGGFATIYRAWDPALEREVALKALLPYMVDDVEIRERFLTEWRALARIDHRNIVKVFDTGVEQGQPFFTMELIDGHTLGDLVRYGHGMPLAQVLTILESLASAVDYLHACGLVHRDVKAGNVMQERGGRVVLMDFGIVAGQDRTHHTRAGESLGTPETMAPEQIRGQTVGRPADIYGLGILTYQLLAGRPPFTGNTISVLHAQAWERPPSLSTARADLPLPISAVVEHALEKNPEKRPGSAAEFVAELEQAAFGGGPEPAITRTTTGGPGIVEALRGLFGRTGQPGAAGNNAALALAGPDGQVVPLAPGSYMLGRDPSCDIRVEDDRASRRHALLTVVPGGAFIEDAGSSNGTLVNGVYIERAALGPGDVLQLGSTVLEVLTDA